MLYVPPIRDYKPFYIQFNTGSAIDIKETYNVIVKAHEYPSAYKVKEPYKNNWKDEHGDDEYIPSSGLPIEAFTFKLECVMFATPTTGNNPKTENVVLEEGLRNFQNALKSGDFKTYDAYTGFGFENARLSEFQNCTSEDFDVMDGMARVIFTVTIKVNNPVTEMVLSGGYIVNKSQNL